MMKDEGASDDELEGASDDKGLKARAFGEAVCLLFCLFIKTRFPPSGSEGREMRRRRASDDGSRSVR